MLNLESLPAEVKTAYENLEAEVTRLTQLLKLREEEIRLLNIQKWGPRADKLSENQLALLPLEAVVTAAEVQREAGLPEAQKQLPHAKKPRPNHPGREALPAHLERREEIIACHPEDCRCPQCGGERPVIGYEVREELEQGRVEIDNNWCEGAIRPIALGRKNWLHLGDQSAGPKIAAAISIVETCRRLDISLRQYRRDILPKLGEWPVKRVSELTPRAWKAARSASAA